MILYSYVNRSIQFSMHNLHSMNNDLNKYLRSWFANIFIQSHANIVRPNSLKADTIDHVGIHKFIDLYLK